MTYPLLYGAAASVLRKLDASYYERFGLPDDLKKGVEELKERLNFLPSIITVENTTDGLITAISKFVYGFHDGIFGYFGLKGLPYHSKGGGDDDDDGYARKNFEYLFKVWLEENRERWGEVANQLTKVEEDDLDPQKSNALSSSLSNVLSSSLSNALTDIEFPQEVKLKLDGLPPHLVPCLAYCALYPEGSSIIRETLVNHWMAQGFLGIEETPNWKQFQAARSSSVDNEGDHLQDLEDIGNYYFDELLHRWGVFVEPIFVFGRGKQAVTVHSCKIDPLMHSAARRIASNEVLIVADGSAGGASAGHIAVHKEISEHEFPLKQLPPQLHTCMYFTSGVNEVALGRLESMIRNLRVLDLAGILFEKLPGTFLRRSDKLRYLGLSRNSLLKSLPLVMPELLQTLAIDGCVHLETNSVLLLECARHLYYTSNKRHVKLYTPTLKILQVSHCSELESLSFDSNFCTLRRLRIFDCPTLVSLQHTNDDLLSNVEELVFHDCFRLDLNSGPFMDSLRCLRYMEIAGLPKLTGLPPGLQSAKVLQYLMIADCMSLRSMDDVLQHLNTLQKLCIYSCHKLSIAPIMFQSLTALQSLDIRNCPKITTTWSTDATATDVAPFISHIPDIILDGQRLFDQKADSFEENDATIAETDSSYTIPCDFPYFVVSSETTAEFLKGMLDAQEYEWELLVLCGLFPGDYEFERDKLVQLWMALGFLKEPLELYGKLHFDNFVNEGYVIYLGTDILTGISKYKINVQKFTIFSNRVKSNNTYTMIEDTSKSKHVSIASKIIDHTTLLKALEEITALEENTTLKTVLLIRDYGSSLRQVPSAFCRAHQFMQVLDLSGSHISELPSSIGDMTQLRFLDLSLTPIERISESIHHLRELQTLKLKGCKHLHALPKGTNQLTSLRHLDFDVIGQLTSMPKGMGLLTEIRILSAFIVSEEDGCNLRELKCLNKLSGSFCISGLEYASSDDAIFAGMECKELERLQLKWNDSIYYHISARQYAEVTAEYLQPCSVLKELQISYFPGNVLPYWMSSVHYDQLVSVTLLRCENVVFIAPSNLPKLKYLNIIDMNGVENVAHDDYRAARYPSLETLTIDGMYKLKAWEKIEVNDCPHLWKLSVKRCPKLAQLDFLPSLPSLTYLEISQCKSIKSLPTDPLPTSLETLRINQCRWLKTTCHREGEDWEKIKHVPKIWIDMKGIGSANEDTDEDSDFSNDDEDSNFSNDDSDEDSDVSTDDIYEIIAPLSLYLDRNMGRKRRRKKEEGEGKEREG